MRRILIACYLLCSLLALASHASAVIIETVPVGNPGNDPDPLTGNLYGSVSYSYSIGKYDVTNAQYVEFLNAKDPTGANTLGLWNSDMSSAINFNGNKTSGSKYELNTGRQNLPVVYVSKFDALRFANWVNNGQGNGDTESGAYTLLGGTPFPNDGDSITRNAGAIVALASESEWYKAAYYDPRSSEQGGPPSDSHYWLYGTSSNSTPIATTPSIGASGANRANFNFAYGFLSRVGAYGGTTSPSGAFDMAGNVSQWNESAFVSSSGQMYHGLRGGTFQSGSTSLRSTARGGFLPEIETEYIGFRLVLIPEPSTIALATIGAAALGCYAVRRRRAANHAQMV